MTARVLRRPASLRMKQVMLYSMQSDTDRSSCRRAMIPVTQVASNLAMPLVLIGLFMGSGYITVAYIGIALFCVAAFFQLVTLPVEFNASRRALRALEETGVLSDSERAGAKKVLGAAALTYVAALAVALVNLLRLLTIVFRASGRSGRR